LLEIEFFENPVFHWIKQYKDEECGEPKGEKQLDRGNGREKDTTRRDAEKYDECDYNGYL
jgi:hypothetical protein